MLFLKPYLKTSILITMFISILAIYLGSILDGFAYGVTVLYSSNSYINGISELNRFLTCTISNSVSNKFLPILS